MRQDRFPVYATRNTQLIDTFYFETALNVEFQQNFQCQPHYINKVLTNCQQTYSIKARCCFTKKLHLCKQLYFWLSFYLCLLSVTGSIPGAEKKNMLILDVRSDVAFANWSAAFLIDQ